MANGAVGDRGRARGDGVHVGRGEGRGISGSSSGTGTGSSGSALVQGSGGAEARDGVDNSAIAKVVRSGRTSAAGRASGQRHAGGGSGRCRDSRSGGHLGRCGGGRSGRLGSRGGLVDGGSTLADGRSRDSVGARADGDQLSTAVLVSCNVNFLVIPVKDDISSPQEGVTKNGEVIVLRNTKLADAQIRLLPDEVLVLDVDDDVTKLEVDTAGGVDDIAVNNVVARGSLQTGRREGGEDLLEKGTGKGADGVAAIEEHRLAVRLVEDLNLGSILLGDAHTIHVNPVTSVAVGRGGCGDDGSLGEGSRKLLDVNSAIGDRASVTVEASDIKTESPALDEALRGQVVNDKGVRALPATQIRASTENTNGSKLAVSGNTENLLVNSQCCIVR